jgi:ribosome-associated translation inhibitor RaiA
MQYVAEWYRLQVEIQTRECGLPEDERLRMQPALDRLGEAVEELGGGQFWLTIVYHPRSQVYHAQAKLKLPGKTIITGEHNEYLDSAVQRCLDKVIRHVEAYKSNPDHQAIEQVRRQAALSTDIIAPVEPDAGKLGEAVQTGDYAAFRRSLLALEEPLRMRVGRWIQRYPEVQALVGESFEIADLVEEVFLLAFEQYRDRPTHISLHEWLASLIDPAVKAFWRHPEDRLAASFAQTVWQYTGKE